MTAGFPTPKVVVSKCLGFEACRYNAITLPSPFVNKLAAYVDYVTVCPEVEVGLGVPRQPIRVVAKKGERRLLQPATGLDVTGKMSTFAEDFLSSLSDVDGFVLKNRSPSCGIKDVKVYEGEKNAASRGGNAGFFGGAVLERFPHAAVEDEGRLRHIRIREHFLTNLFTIARFRAAKSRDDIAALTDFHAAHKLIFMAYDQDLMRRMGRLGANEEKRPVSEVVADYAALLSQALSTAPTQAAVINVLHHALGYFKKGLASEEKKLFLDKIEEYRDERIPVTPLTTLLESWTARFDEPYLKKQVFFRPYPADLVELDDLCFL